MTEYLLAFIEGLLSFISPCMLPLLPVYVSYFAANSDAADFCDNAEGGDDAGCGSVGAKSGSLVLFLRTLAFVFGFSAVFCLLGVLAGTLGRVLARYSVVVSVICGTLVVLFGLSYLGVFNLPLKGRNAGRRVRSLTSAFAFGCIYASSVSPCVGVFLGSALALASASATVFKGFLLLLSYSLGLGVPFIVSALALDRLKGFFGLIKRHYRTIDIICGSLLVFMGILMMFGFGTLSWNGNVLKIKRLIGLQDSVRNEGSGRDAGDSRTASGKRRSNLLEIRRTSMNEIKLTSGNFTDEVINSQIPVLVDFWAEWCGPCRMLSPVIADIADDYHGKIKVGKVNVDEQPDLASKYGVSAIPAVFVFKNGEVVKSFAGFRQKDYVLSFIDEYVK